MQRVNKLAIKSVFKGLKFNTHDLMERNLMQCSIFIFLSEGSSETQETEPKRIISS